MKTLLFILGLFFSVVVTAQFAPTSSKTKFSNGIALGTRDSTAYGVNDSLVVVIDRNGKLIYRSTDGYWKSVATGGNLGLYMLLADTAAMVANLLRKTDTSNMLSPYRTYFPRMALSMAAGSGAYNSSTGVITIPTNTSQLTNSSFVDLTTAQTVAGAKTFSSDLNVNSLGVGRGGGNIASNTANGAAALGNNTTGFQNTAVGSGALQLNSTGNFNTANGFESLQSNSTGSANTAIGRTALNSNTTGDDNTSIGLSALASNTTGFQNTAIGRNAGYGTGTFPNTTGSNNTYVGFQTRGNASTNTNETVIGSTAIGNGSNSMTFGNTSVTANYFSGFMRAASFRISALNTAPASATDTGTLGEIRWDANYMYVCTATNTWKRVAISTW